MWKWAVISVCQLALSCEQHISITDVFGIYTKMYKTH